MADRLSKIVPYGADQTLYLVVDSLPEQGGRYREIEIERADLQSIIADLLVGQFNHAVRVIAFNTLEHWVEDVSGKVAEEIQCNCDIESVPVPEHVRDFVVSHIGAARPLQFA